MNRVFLSLGSNLDDRLQSINSMEKAVQKFLSCGYCASSLMETEPVCVDTVQPWYLNKIVSGFFSGFPEELLLHCFEIENVLGRSRNGYKAPRCADVDILLFGKNIVQLPHLTIPHPAITQRRFLLQGIKEIDKSIIIPKVGLISTVYAAMTQEVSNQKVNVL